MDQFCEGDKLDGSNNYVGWTILVKSQLKLVDLFHELNFGVKPDADGNYTDGGAHLTAHEKQKKKDEATAILASAVKPKFLPTVDKFSDDPAKCWEHFEQRFGGDNLLRLQLLLEQKLQNTRMNEGSCIELYINKIDELAGQLASVNAEADETRLIHIVLQGLPLSWSPIVEIFRADLSRSPKPTYSNLVQRLQSDEYWRKGKQTETNEEAMAVTRSFARRGRYQPRTDIYSDRTDIYSDRFDG